MLDLLIRDNPKDWQAWGERAEIQAGGADAQQVRLNSPEFVRDRPQHFRSRRDLDTHQLFNGLKPREFVVDRRGIIHPIDDRHVLVVVEILHQLFEAAMEVTDVRDGPEDPLAAC